jgi:hypothetical protein
MLITIIFEMIKDILKKRVNNERTISAFLRLSFGFDEWQLKLLEDKPFIMELLALPESDSVWLLFILLAQHPGMTFNTLLN